MNITFPPQIMITSLLINVLSLFAVTGQTQYGQKVPDEFSYPKSQETIQIDQYINSKSLSGVVIDPNGAVVSEVLVEKVQPGWRKRLAAVLSDCNGRFAFGGTARGTHFVRISKPGFNTILLRVKVNRKIKSELRIELGLSH